MEQKGHQICDQHNKVAIKHIIDITYFSKTKNLLDSVSNYLLCCRDCSKIIVLMKLMIVPIVYVYLRIHIIKFTANNFAKNTT